MNRIFDATIHGKAILEIQKREEEFIEKILRTSAVPPIKGKITAGKIKWRNIRLVSKTEINKTTIYLTQKGIRISPDYTVNFNINFK
jgi:hypothetical protein